MGENLWWHLSLLSRHEISVSFFFSQYYVVTKYSFWRQIISVSTDVKDRCSTVDHDDMSGLDGWDGTLGGKNLTLLKRDEKDI